MLTDPWIVLGVAALEAAIGYPRRLESFVPHPAVWVGNLIAALETRWNTPSFSPTHRKALGTLCLIVLMAVAGFAGWSVEQLGTVGMIVVATVGLAQRSLYAHVAAVLHALETENIPAARDAVSRIVGRDTATLDEQGVCTAALETLAESFNDGVVAPVFWCVVGGVPGLFIYKAVNTADSMIGHKEPRWRDFGWASARFDDLLNLAPARLAAAFLAGPFVRAWRTMRRDAAKHASPNAGWPEAAMAGALNVQLGGTVSYDGITYNRPSFGIGRAPDANDLRRGLRLYVGACGIMWILLFAGGALWRLW